MKWQQAADAPQPPDWFVKALKLIDPEMRVVWAMERYLKEEWAIERKMPPEQYWLGHESLLQDGGARFVDQPVYDCSQRETDPVTGEFVGYKQVGTRKYDLAPEYEWIAFRPTLDQVLLDSIQKRVWEMNHPEQAEAQRKAEADAKAKAEETKTNEAVKEGTDEALLEVGKIRQFGAGKVRSEQWDQ